jgi:uncharacterized protein YukE
MRKLDPAGETAMVLDRNRRRLGSESFRQKHPRFRRLFAKWGWILAALALLSPGLSGRASDEPQVETLKRNKLKAQGALQVLEDEAEFKTKLTDARRLQRELSYSILKQQGTMSPEQYKKTLQAVKDELSQMRSQISVTNQQMKSVPRFRGRFASTYAQEQYNELLLYRNQLQTQVDQESAWLNQLQGQKVDPKATEKVEAEVRDRREAYHQALSELRSMADAVAQKYTDLAKDGEVKDAITALGEGKREKPRLGPSHDFLNNVKLLEKLEKAESAGDSLQEKPSRRSRSKKGSKTKDSAASAPASGKPGE